MNVKVTNKTMIWVYRLYIKINVNTEENKNKFHVANQLLIFVFSIEVHLSSTIKKNSVEEYYNLISYIYSLNVDH